MNFWKVVENSPTREMGNNIKFQLRLACPTWVKWAPPQLAITGYTHSLSIFCFSKKKEKTICFKHINKVQSRIAIKSKY